MAVTQYLVVEEFLTDLAGCRGLLTAFETGLIDWLAQVPGVTPPRFEAVALNVLLTILEANNIIHRDGDQVALTPRFIEALAYRDLLTTKLELAHALAPDLIDLFTLMLTNPDQFLQRSRVFDLFGYQRCFEVTPENIQATQRWMRWTTTLTKYETPAILAQLEWERYAGRWLDIGGNSGEFIRQGYLANQRLAPVIVDLPVVCHVAMERFKALPGNWPIGIFATNALTEPWLTDCQLISFKSMLHDWPTEAAETFLQKAVAALNSGGTILIVEREQLPFTGKLPFGQIPMFLFFRSFRKPDFYVQRLHSLGLINVQVRRVQLESPFMIMTAEKP